MYRHPTHQIFINVYLFDLKFQTAEYFNPSPRLAIANLVPKSQTISCNEIQHTQEGGRTLIFSTTHLGKGHDRHLLSLRKSIFNLKNVIEVLKKNKNREG